MVELNNKKYMFSSHTPLSIVGEGIEEERRDQINKFIGELTTCKVLLRDLIDRDVSYSVRNELLNIAMYIINDGEIYSELLQTGESPINKIVNKVEHDSKYLNMWKDYIIAYTIILGNPLYKSIQDYIQISEYTGKSEVSELSIFNSDGEVKGLVLVRGKASAIILTSIGEFKKVKVKEECTKGVEFKGKERKKLKDYKLYASILLILLSVIVCVGGFNYKNTVSTIVVKADVVIKLQVNIFNMIVDADSITNEGKEILKKLNVTDRDLDVALYRIIECMDKENLIPDSGIIVTISGKPMKYGIINKTEDYIYVNNIDIRFNNSGIEHKLN